MATVNLNKNASMLMGGNSKIRLRIGSDFRVQIRPTERKSAVGLPKGEVLIDLRTKKQGSGRTLRFTMPNIVDEGGDHVITYSNFELSQAKHGWFVMVRCDKPVLIPGQPQTAGGSVTSK